MAARRKPKTFAEDLDAIRATALHLLSLKTHAVPMAWTDWELDFLEGMAGRSTDEPLSDAQVAKFDQLKRSAGIYDKVDGLSIARIIAGCALQADYLDDEDDREYLLALHLAQAAWLRRRDVGRLLRICRELDVIEAHHGFIDETAEARV